MVTSYSISRNTAAGTAVLFIRQMARRWH